MSCYSCHLHQGQLEPFSILGLPRFAPQSDITAAYRRLAPICLLEKQGLDRFTIISAAFEFLTTNHEKLLKRRSFTDPFLLFAATFGIEPLACQQLVVRTSIKRESPSFHQQLSHKDTKRPRTTTPRRTWVMRITSLHVHGDTCEVFCFNSKITVSLAFDNTCTLSNRKLNWLMIMASVLTRLHLCIFTEWTYCDDNVHSKRIFQ